MAQRIVDVLVPVALDHAYSYRAPPDLHLQLGDIVAVPLGASETVGVVWADNVPVRAGLHNRLKDVEAKLDYPALREELRKLVDWVANYTLAPKGMVLRMALRMGELGPEREPMPSDRRAAMNARTSRGSIAASAFSETCAPMCAVRNERNCRASRSYASTVFGDMRRSAPKCASQRRSSAATSAEAKWNALLSLGDIITLCRLILRSPTTPQRSRASRRTRRRMSSRPSFEAPPSGAPQDEGMCKAPPP